MQVRLYEVIDNPENDQMFIGLFIACIFDSMS